LIKKDFDKGRLKNYLLKAKISKTISTEEVLLNLDVAKMEGKNILFNNADVIFFAKHTHKIIPQVCITCIRYNGTESVGIIDRIGFNDDLVFQY